MKVLHGMTEIAGQGTNSVKGLQKNGINAHMAVWRKNTFGYKYDYDLKIGYAYILYPFYFLKMLFFALYAIGRYDCFHFHFGRSLLPGNFDLKWIRILKKKVFMEFHGSDIRGSFKRDGYDYLELPVTNQRRQRSIKRIVDNVDGIILHDEELRFHLPLSRTPVYIVPLRMDIESFIPSYPKKDVKIPVIVHAPSKRKGKGTETILKVLKEIDRPYKLVLVENKTQEEALKLYQSADIVIDQICTGTYGVFSIESMALGKPVIVYINEKMQKTFPPELPLISADKNNLKEQIEKLLDDAEARYLLGVKGRQYAEKYHDCCKNAKVLAEIYKGKCPVLEGADAFTYAGNFQK